MLWYAYAAPTPGRRQGVGRPRSGPSPPTLGRRQGGGLPRIACPSGGSDPTLTCAVLSHSNVDMPLQPPRPDAVKAWGAHAQVHLPHARTALRRGAPTHHLPLTGGLIQRWPVPSYPTLILWYAYRASTPGRRQGVGRPRSGPSPPRPDGVKAWGAHAHFHLPPRSDGVKAGDSHASPAPHMGLIQCWPMPYYHTLMLWYAYSAPTRGRRQGVGRPCSGPFPPMLGQSRGVGLPLSEPVSEAHHLHPARRSMIQTPLSWDWVPK